MVLLTRAPRFLGTMWYYYSLLLTFTFIIFRYVCSGCSQTFLLFFPWRPRPALLVVFLMDCLEYKQLDIVEFQPEHCKELVKQVLAVCSTHQLQKLYLCDMGVLVVHQGAQLHGLGHLHTASPSG